MKIRTMLTLLALFAAALMCLADDVNIGTWKAKDAKFIPGWGRNASVVIAPAGDSVKVTSDGFDARGKPLHDEWTGKFDGKDYPVTGDPDGDTRAYKPINDHTFEMTSKKGGKITGAGRVVYSADGKTRTVTGNITDDKGAKKKITTVYEKQ